MPSKQSLVLGVLFPATLNLLVSPAWSTCSTYWQPDCTPTVTSQRQGGERGQQREG